MNRESNPKTSVKVQRAIDGRLLGVAIFLDVVAASGTIGDGAEELHMEVFQVPSGMHIEIGGK